MNDKATLREALDEVRLNTDKIINLQSKIEYRVVTYIVKLRKNNIVSLRDNHSAITTGHAVKSDPVEIDRKSWEFYFNKENNHGPTVTESENITRRSEDVRSNMHNGSIKWNTNRYIKNSKIIFKKYLKFCHLKLIDLTPSKVKIFIKNLFL